jgi:hypothetical protein
MSATPLDHVAKFNRKARNRISGHDAHAPTLESYRMNFEFHERLVFFVVDQFPVSFDCVDRAAIFGNYDRQPQQIPESELT